MFEREKEKKKEKREKRGLEVKEGFRGVRARPAAHRVDLHRQSPPPASRWFGGGGAMPGAVSWQLRPSYTSSFVLNPSARKSRDISSVHSTKR